SATYAAGESASVAASRVTMPSRLARSRQWARTSVRGRRPRRYLPRASAPTAPGRVYAASVSPTKSPSLPAGAIRTASHAIVTVLIPSPSEEMPSPDKSRRARRSCNNTRYTCMPVTLGGSCTQRFSIPDRLYTGQNQSERAAGGDEMLSRRGGSSRCGGSTHRALDGGPDPPPFRGGPPRQEEGQWPHCPPLGLPLSA